MLENSAWRDSSADDVRLYPSALVRPLVRPLVALWGSLLKFSSVRVRTGYQKVSSIGEIDVIVSFEFPLEGSGFLLNEVGKSLK